MLSSRLSWERLPAGRAPSRALPLVRLPQLGLQASFACCTVIWSHLQCSASRCSNKDLVTAWNAIVHYQSLCPTQQGLSKHRASAKHR